MEAVEDILIILGICVLLIIYAWLTKNISRNEYKKHLKLCLNAFAGELRPFLIRSKEKAINSLILDYLENQTNKKLLLIVDHLRNKYTISRYSSTTISANVMKRLIIEIMEEQLQLKYNNGIYFDKETFDNLENEAPFVKNFCLIARVNEDEFYTDACIGFFDFNLNSMILNGLNIFLYNVTRRNIQNYDDLIIPPTVIILFKSAYVRYNFDFSHINFDRFITLYNGQNYSLLSLILNIPRTFRFDYELRTGDVLRRKGTSTGFFSKYSYNFLSLMVLKAKD